MHCLNISAKVVQPGSCVAGNTMQDKGYFPLNGWPESDQVVLRAKRAISKALHYLPEIVDEALMFRHASGMGLRVMEQEFFCLKLSTHNARQCLHCYRGQSMVQPSAMMSCPANYSIGSMEALLSGGWSTAVLLDLEPSQWE